MLLFEFTLSAPRLSSGPYPGERRDGFCTAGRVEESFPGGLSLRTRPVGGRKGRHPLKGCFKGLLKNPQMWELLRHNPRGAGQVGVSAAFMKRKVGAARCSRFPCWRTQTHSKERYSLLITREATNGQPPFRSFLHFALGLETKPRGRRRLSLLPVRAERPDEGGASSRPGQLVDVKRPGNRARESGRI